MVLRLKKMFRFCLPVWVVVYLLAIGTAAGAEGEQAEKKLQPQGLDCTGVYALRRMEPSLTGTGVKFGLICRSISYVDGEPQNDYRPATGHNCFKGRQFNFHDPCELSAGISPHATAICSILLGEDPNAFNQHLGRFFYQGAAPQAEADVYEFWHFLINNVYPQLPPDVDILAAGIGSQFADWWTRGIESMAEHYGLIVVAGIGNGLCAYDPVLYPAAGANVIGVGVVNSVNTENLATSLANFSLAYPDYSSFGPTADGRCQPDIIAPGNCLAAKAAEPNRYEPTGNWSSFSTPVVAGTIGLLVQKAKQDVELSDAVSKAGGNCVIKAILLNSASKLPYWHKGRLEKGDDHTVPLDYVQGAGMLNALSAYEHLVAGQSKPGAVSTTGWDLNQLQKDQSPENAYRIAIGEPADKFITATAAWNRHYESTYPFASISAKDADLRLELWAVDPNNPDKDYLLDYSDSGVDNLEHIYSPTDPNYCNYEIVVSYSGINDSNQIPAMEQYGLAWNASNKPKAEDIFWYDLNADGIVDSSDFTIFINNSLDSIKSPESYLLGDINTDGTIDGSDFQILFDHKDTQADWHTE